MIAFKKLVLLGLAAGCILLYQNCTPFEGITVGASSSEVSFYKGLNEKVFRPKCLECHSSLTTAGGLDMATHNSIIVSGTVSAGNALNSLLYTVVSNGLTAKHATVTGLELEGLATWINSGALENEIPVVNAGADVIVRLPTSSASVTALASDLDGEIVSYLWEQVSGPNTSVIADPTIGIASISGLVSGLYNFSVTVTDDMGAMAMDSVNVSVTLADNILPTVNAGADKALMLPTNSVSIIASASDPDGTIVSYAWTSLSGPAIPTLANVTTSTLTASDLVIGTYVFNIVVTDNRGGTANDTVSVVVSNVAPTYTQLNSDIFIAKCTNCHGNAVARGGYSMATYSETLLRVVPNNANGSQLFLRTNDNSMPPGNPLSATDKAKIRDWINAGALNN